MPQRPIASLNDISAIFHLIAERLTPQVTPHQPLRLDAETRWVLTRLLHDLRGHVPGLRVFGSPSAAISALADAQHALHDGDPGRALVVAMRGLACSPQHPELFYAAAAAALENGAVVESVMLLRHTLWLKPQHPGAMSDLGAMFESGLMESGQGAAPNDVDCRPHTAAHQPPFELVDEDPDEPESEAA